MKKVGILGLAHGHVLAYGGEWRDHPEYGVEMVSGWDADPVRAKVNCDALGIAVAPSKDAILSDPEIDAVVISSETKYHAELAEMAADAKKAIIMYKPMALTMAEADRIVAAVERNGVPFTLGYQMRVDPQNIKIKELIKSEAIGKTLMYRRRHALSTHTWDGFEHTWHANRELNRDIFADDSAHPIDMLNWLFGVPETVMCEMTTAHNTKVANDNGVALFKYGNGLIAEISCYFTCTASEITTEVYGSKGTVQQYFGDAVSTSVPRAEGLPGLKWLIHGEADWTDSQIATPPVHRDRLCAQALPFADFLHGKRPPICSVYEARDSLRMVLACYVSSRTGTRVHIDDQRVYDI